MAKYRLNITNGGYHGYWTVQTHGFWGWREVSSFSIYVYGNEQARSLARDVLVSLRNG